jgi:diacylglycerol kinase family enzyme
MPPPLHIVFNPGSGHGDAEARRRRIAEACAAAGRSLQLVAVDDPRQLPALAQQAVAAARADGGVVVAAGGDGTINAVAQAVLGSGCAFGVLPQGTFNYFGRAHGIPDDPDAALQLLLTGQPQPVQVGLVNGRVFLVNASLGLYPRLLEDREAWKRQLGRSRLVALAALLATLLRGHRNLRLALELRGRQQALRTPTLFIGNNPLQLAQIGLPEAQAVQAGALAVVALRPVSRLALLGLALRGALGRLGEADQVIAFGSRALTVRPGWPWDPRGVKVATDGEVRRLRPPLQFSVSPRPLHLIRPAPAAAAGNDTGAHSTAGAAEEATATDTA